MMKRICGVFIWLFILSVSLAAAQGIYTTQDIRSEYDQPFRNQRASTASGALKERNDTAVGLGMEVRDVGGVRVIVPEGTKVHKEGSQVVFEDIGEYLARRFALLEEEVAVLREGLSQKEQQIQELEVALEELRKKISVQGGKE